MPIAGSAATPAGQMTCDGRRIARPRPWLCMSCAACLGRRKQTHSNSGPVAASAGARRSSLPPMVVLTTTNQGPRNVPSAAAQPGSALLSPADHLLMMIDHQSQMSFATKSIDAIMLRNNAALVSNAARIFGVPTVLTTVAEKHFPAPCSTKSRASSQAKR